jgi:hypothetical protein
MLRRTVSRSVCLANKHPFGAYDQIFITVRQLRICWCGARTGLSFTIAAGPSQRSHSCVQVPRNSCPYFTLSDSRLPQPGGPGPRTYIPPEQGGPVIPSSTGFPFRRLLRFAGLRWKYSNPPPRGIRVCQSQSESYITTDGQLASLSWNKAPICDLRPDLYYCQIVASLFVWEALSDERTSLSFTIAAGPRHRSHSWVRIPWDSWPYFTVSDSRLPFSSPPTTRRAAVEVFDPASTRGRYTLLKKVKVTLRLTVSQSKSKSHFDWRSVNQSHIATTDGQSIC